MKRILFALVPMLAYGLTIDEAVEKAIKQNLQIKQQRVELRKAKIQLKEDYNLWAPEFFLNFSYTTYKDIPYTKIPYGVLPFPLSFKQADKDFKNFSAGINFPIFTGFARLNKISISKLEIKSNRHLLKETINQITAKTKAAYLDALMAQAIVEVYKKQLEAVEKHLYRVKEFHKEGLVTKVDILQTQVKMSEVKRNLRKAEGDLKIAKARLRNILNENINEDLELKPVKLKIPENLDLQALYNLALKNRNIIRSVRLKEKEVEKLEKIRLSSFFPKVAAQAYYFYTDQYPYLDPKDNYALSIGLQWKFQGIKPYYSTLKTKLEARKVKLQLKQLKNNIKLEVKAAYENFQTAKENLKVAEDTLAEAEEYYIMVVEQFKNQLASTTDVLDAESMLTSARKGREISYYQLIKAFVELEKAVGGRINAQ